MVEPRPPTSSRVRKKGRLAGRRPWCAPGGCWLWALRRARLGLRPLGCGAVVLGGAGVEGGDAQEVVGGGRVEEPGPVVLPAPVAELAAAGDGLDPSEGFLDPGPDPLACSMPGVAGGGARRVSRAGRGGGG